MLDIYSEYSVTSPPGRENAFSYTACVGQRQTHARACAHTHTHTHTHTPHQRSGRPWYSNEYHLELALGSQASLGTRARHRPPSSCIPLSGGFIIALPCSSLPMPSKREWKTGTPAHPGAHLSWLSLPHSLVLLQVGRELASPGEGAKVPAWAREAEWAPQPRVWGSIPSLQSRPGACYLILEFVAEQDLVGG